MPPIVQIVELQASDIIATSTGATGADMLWRARVDYFEDEEEEDY